jgi:hypothetical protein
MFLTFQPTVKALRVPNHTAISNITQSENVSIAI